MALFNWDDLSKKTTVESQKEIMERLKEKIALGNQKKFERLVGGCETRGQVLQVKEDLTDICENSKNKLDCCAEIFEKPQPIRDKFIDTMKIIDKLNLEDNQKADIIISYGILLNHFPEDMINKKFHELFIMSAATSDLETVDHYNICVQDFIKDNVVKSLLIIKKDDSIEEQIDTSKKVLDKFMKNNPNEVCQKLARVRNRKLRAFNIHR